MLSRVAERVYWAARYIERAEGTARLVLEYMHMMLDLPIGIQPPWQRLIDVVGGQAPFFGHYRKADERNTVKFLIIDGFNPGSIDTAMHMARENLRTTRDVVPAEAFERANELHHYVRDNLDKALTRRGRYLFLRSVIRNCQQITGLLAGTMSHDEAYDFIRIGRNLERADMTSRIVDVGAAVLLPRREQPQAYDKILWVYVLRTLSAYQMYRQHVRWRVSGPQVVGYLLKDQRFPRAVRHCMGEIASSLSNLPRNEDPLRKVSRVQRKLTEADVRAMGSAELSEFIDDLQVAMHQIHTDIAQTWFNLDHSNEGPATAAN